MHASAAGGREGGEDAWEGSGGGDLDGACFDYDADDLSGPETSGMRCFVALSVLSGGVWVWGHGGGGGGWGGRAGGAPPPPVLGAMGEIRRRLQNKWGPWAKAMG